MNFTHLIFKRRNQLLRGLLPLLLLFQSQFTFSQKTNTDSSTTIHKNTIKGMGYVLGNVFTGGFAGISIGYERQISKHSVVELTGYYYYQIVDEMGSKSKAFCIMPGYKYVVSSKRKVFNNTWYSIFLTYYSKRNYPNSDTEEDPWNEYLNGIGCSLGRKMYLSKNCNWFLEIGIGASFNLFNLEPKSSHSSESLSILPRPIIQIGGKF
jgi:hypothetical protein